MARVAWAAVALLLCLLALARPIDHDESQYVAAAVLTANGALPYRDYAYLQTPLQPFLFAPVAGAAGPWAWPALRLANALCGALALLFTFRAARLHAPARVALAATALFATCDSFLFCVGTARNDALPAACLAASLWLAVRAERDGASPARALGIGLLLAAATAAKISYAFPAAAHGLWALTHRRHRPALVLLGAAPIAVLVAWTAALAPTGFLFGTWTFPAHAPADFYAGRPERLSIAAKLIDMAKFLALGPALLALLSLMRGRRPVLPFVLLVAGLIAAAMPTPTWRQYLLPALPPLFVLLAARWAARPPGPAARAAFGAFALIGLAPTAVALARERPAMPAAMRDGAAIREAMDRAGVIGPVATLSPQFLPATGRLPDPRFATGPFVFRARRLALPGSLTDLRLVERDTVACALLPGALLAGGEGAWVGGDDELDRVLERAVAVRGYRRVAVPGTPFRLWVRPAPASPPITPS